MPPVKATCTPSLSLAYFVAYALNRTRLSSTVTFAALLLLRRLKPRFPATRGSSGHRLFISVLMIASKVTCDDTYSNQSWCIVSQNIFTLSEINQMEREMCAYLEWNLNVQGDEVVEFEACIRAEHGSAAVAASSPSSVPVFTPALNAYHTPEMTLDRSQSIQPAPSVYWSRPQRVVQIGLSFQAPRITQAEHLHNSELCPQPPCICTATSSLTSSPVSDYCKTPSAVSSTESPCRSTKSGVSPFFDSRVRWQPSNLQSYAVNVG
ncbi:hypothetical protein JCM24511_00773 [Saitozyma sp. JCM 24511]|nr:hypothetical protein JCM24511_00773 [Saitozyma sp. JCM 24511]